MNANIIGWYILAVGVLVIACVIKIHYNSLGYDISLMEAGVLAPVSAVAVVAVIIFIDKSFIGKFLRRFLGENDN